MKLKTLNDFETGVDGPSYEALLHNLKAEAIKWVKEMRKEQGKQPRDLDWLPYEIGTTIDSEKTKSQFSEMDYSETIQFVKHFFNITEEDLS